VRNGFLISLVCLAFAAGVASAQDEPLPQKTPDDQTKEPGKSPPLIEPPQKQANDQPAEMGPAPKTDFDFNAPPLSSESCWCQGCDTPDCGCSSRCWGSLEYLLWWIKDGPVPGPLATTGSPSPTRTATDLTGALGQPTTQVLFGGSNLDYGTFSGMRLTLGGWITPCQTFGLEASAFLLEQRSVRFAAASNGTPALYIPAVFNNGAKELQDRLAVAEPFNTNQTAGGFTGNLLWASTTRLWGTEVNGVFVGWSSCNWEGAFLAGFRYVDLQESLALHTSITTLAQTVTDATQTQPFVTSLADSFETRNQFYGGQLGAKVGYRWSFLSVDLVGKIALGDAHQVVSINGVSSLSGPGTPTPPGAGTFPGGLFAQPSNIGRQTNDEFTVIPELQIKVGCDILPGLRAFVGYDFLYWGQVVRPGNEIDRNLNLSQSAAISQTNGTLVGAPFPQALFNRSDFYASGITFGLELRY